MHPRRALEQAGYSVSFGLKPNVNAGHGRTEDVLILVAQVSGSAPYISMATLIPGEPRKRRATILLREAVEDLLNPDSAYWRAMGASPAP